MHMKNKSVRRICCTIISTITIMGTVLEFQQIQQEVTRQQINKIMGRRPYSNMGMASILRK